MVIITGGAGFIGSVLMRELNNEGIEDILIVDDLGKGEKWRNLVKGKYSDFIHKDLFLDRIKKNNAPKDIEGIVHLGACSSTTENDANYLMENNFHYSQAVCSYAVENGIRFINASSAATYGAGELGFFDNTENLPKLRPLNMYGYSKQLMDLWLIKNGFEKEVASLKFFNVYGPNEYHKGSMQSVALKLFHQIETTGEALLFESNVPDLGHGEQKRDFVYVKDCARLIFWLLYDGKRVGGILNVGTGRGETFNSLAEAVFRVMKREPSIRYIPMPEKIAGKYQNFTQADMNWLDQKECPVSFRGIEAGIEDYIGNYLAKTDIYM